ncbi:MAG: M20 family metallo-hydrolase [Candidatus Aenigmarchaeota archaeon]|nr:M20 family metallo-hydrolase [Candidatus Aenigmarchaeota archaeon]
MSKYLNTRYSLYTIENIMKQKLIYLQKNLCSIKALSPDFEDGEGEYKKAEWLKKYLIEKNLGKIRQYNTLDERAKEKIRPNFNLFCKGQTDQNLWIISHLDVVPINDLEKWNSNPFELKIDGNVIYGRGVIDNHNGICSSLLALESLLEKNKKPYYNINLLFVSDEETGSKYGMRYLLDNYNLFKKDDLIIIPDAGDEAGLKIIIAEKCQLWLKFKTIGKEAHGSRPNFGINAFRAASYFIVELNRLYDIFDEKDNLFTIGSTFEPTKKLKNVNNINIIPGEDVFFMDCRLLPSVKETSVLDEIDKIQKKIEEKFRVKIERENLTKDTPSPSTPENAKIIRLLVSAIKKIKGKEPYLKGIGGGTFASFLRKKGLDAVVYSTINDSAHCANEYCEIDKLIEDILVFESVMMNNKI